MNETDPLTTEAGAKSAALNWGIIGMGQVARLRVIPAIRRRQAGAVLACAGRCPLSTAETAKDLSIPRVHNTWEDLLADPEINAVYIATPNQLHAKIAVAALEQGKHVLCEKPMALTVNDAQRIVQARQKTNDRIFRLALQIRCEAVLRRAAELIRAGAIGDVRFIDIERLAPVHQPGGWRRERALGGSVLFDVGVHLLDLVPWLMDSPISTVSALAHPSNSETGEQSVTMLAMLANGTQATLRCSRELPHGRNTFVAIGTEGMLSTSALRWEDQHKLTLRNTTGEQEELFAATDLHGEQVELFAKDALYRTQHLPDEFDGLRLVTITHEVEQAIAHPSTQK